MHKVMTKFIKPSKKFWIHRCNSVEKAREMSKKFPGIEIDATFYKNEVVGKKFDISHNPAKTVEFPLENFMPIFADSDIKIWFDFKNLSEDNVDDSVNELINLAEKYNVAKNNFIIESHNLNALKIFHSFGFKTAYFVTVSDAIFYDKNYKNKFNDEINFVIKSGGIDALSFPIDYYEVVKNLETNLDYLTWDTFNRRWWNFYLNFDEVFKDSRVKIILVEFSSEFDR